MHAYTCVQMRMSMVSNTNFIPYLHKRWSFNEPIDVNMATITLGLLGFNAMQCMHLSVNAFDYSIREHCMWLQWSHSIPHSTRKDIIERK